MSYDEIEITEGSAGFKVIAKTKKPRAENSYGDSFTEYPHYFTNADDLIGWLSGELAAQSSVEAT